MRIWHFFGLRIIIIIIIIIIIDCFGHFGQVHHKAFDLMGRWNDLKWWVVGIHGICRMLVGGIICSQDYFDARC
ncbi:hypothetical protein B0T09DRAFT_350032 [Sordaria sp. MPI-SDFR-AT-0083]|nr:hypothetical protein B0T09DRAFT_350032 [Sordaria sp. MPI-SDFR-AT-0083]